MDQKFLREFENRCIQEEPAFCMAACPLHVDVRTFLRHMGEGKNDIARKVLDKTMPFPGILGRICDHPCEAKCRRKDAGDAIAIGALERTCVTSTSSLVKIPRLPKKNKPVAVIGSGLSSLTVAWDLLRKGYEIAVFEPDNYLGGNLWAFPDHMLPKEIIAAETALLQDMGVRINLKIPVTPERFETLCSEFRAVYIGQDNRIVCDFGLQHDKNGLKVDPVTWQTARKGVFAGGISDEAGSPVFNAAQGRWAATSIDRHIQNVSLTASRQIEGSLGTRLYTGIDGVVPRKRTAMEFPEDGYSEDEAREEAGRCLQCECMECVKICPYLEKYKGYPKSYARQIYNNLSIVKGEHKANLLTNSCSLCRLCETVCPENFSMADFCHAARTEMVETGKMPPSAHEFALLDMAFSNSEKCTIARHAPGQNSSRYVFFPGCQLAGSAPGHVEKTWEWLRETLDGGTGLMLGCCGAPAHWSARSDMAEEVMAQFRAKWEEMGRPQPVLACSSCMEMFGKFFPEAKAVSLWEIMAREELPESALKARFVTPPVTVIDPCTARHDTKVQDSVRHILKKLGLFVEEMKHSRELTECCGFGGLMENAAPDVAREFRKRRAAQSDLDYVAYCAVCRDHLATTGKRTIHLLDFVWPEETGPSPALRENPGYSMRHENRARLKEKLLREVWKEENPEAAEYEKIVFEIRPDVRAILEERRILDEDIRKVLHYVESGGKFFRNPKNGRFLAFYQPLKVTFWVEYTPSANGFVIHNAWCHRMTVEGDVK